MICVYIVNDCIKLTVVVLPIIAWHDFIFALVLKRRGVVVGSSHPAVQWVHPRFWVKSALWSTVHRPLLHPSPLPRITVLSWAFLQSTYNQNHAAFAFLCWNILSSLMSSRVIHIVINDNISFFLNSNIPLCIHTIFSLSIHFLMDIQLFPFRGC